MFKAGVLLILQIVFIFSGCSSDLPDSTTKGKSTFGMEIDGEKWENPAIYSPRATYYPIEKSLRIESLNRYNDERIVLIINNIEFAETRQLDYVTSVEGASDSTRLLVGDDFENSFLLNSSETSVLVITKFDISEKIVSATFSMQLINREGVLRDVTSGRFDLQMAIID